MSVVSSLALLLLAGVMLAAGVALIAHWALRPRAVPYRGAVSATLPPAPLPPGPGLSPSTVTNGPAALRPTPRSAARPGGR